MDLSVLLVPLIAVLAVFGIAVATSDTVVVFEPISIPPSMAEYGYSDDIVTRQVLD